MIEKSRSNHQKVILCIACILFIIAIGVTVYGFFFQKSKVIYLIGLFCILFLVVIGIPLFAFKTTYSLSKPLFVLYMSFFLCCSLGSIADCLYQATNISKDTWVNFFAVLIGSGVPVIFAYMISQKEKKERDKIPESIVENFLNLEIVTNFNILRKDKSLFETLSSREYKKDEEFNGTFNIRCDEYATIKYDLIKYNNTIIKEVLEIYRMFSLLTGIKSFKDLHESDYTFVCDTFSKYQNKYK